MSKTLTAYQYKGLITKSKQGWAAFYKSENNAHERSLQVYETNRQLLLKIKEREAPLEEKSHIPDFVKNEITEMIDKLKIEISCPICYDILESKDIKFSNCGHKYCSTCLSKINECAICRKKIYRKD